MGNILLKYSMHRDEQQMDTEMQNVKLERVRETLMAIYKKDLKQINSAWSKFGIRSNSDIESFYNNNIVVCEMYQNYPRTFKNIGELFATNNQRFFIEGGFGYGKSSFANEIVYQWVKCETLWTKSFSHLFLFRLAHLKQTDTQSLQSLFATVLSQDDTEFITEWLEDKINWKKCLFVFDGLDELQHDCCKEVQNLIAGAHCGNVVVTSMKCEKFYELSYIVSDEPYFVQLLGYTKEWISQEVKCFDLNSEIQSDDLRDLLKVPLVNMLYLVTYKEHPAGRFSNCSVIEAFVLLVCNRYRSIDHNFLKADEENFLLILGQIAQNQFSFIQESDVKFPHVTSQFLSMATDIGLVYENSTTEQFYFLHRSIAEYCAAYFWSKREPLKIRIIEHREVDFICPERCWIEDYSTMFSCFLSHFNFEYKLFLWQNFEYRIPYLDAYESLPIRQFSGNIITFDSVPAADKSIVLEKLEFGQKSLIMFYAQFEEDRDFTRVSTMEYLTLLNCSLKINHERNCKFLKVKELEMNECTFYLCDKRENELDRRSDTGYVLERMSIILADFSTTRFLSSVMKDCITLKSFRLYWSFDNFMKLNTSSESVNNINCFGDGWIGELQNNETLLRSIENFELWCHTPDDLTIMFETLGKMINLKTLDLEVDQRNLTKQEENAFAFSLKTGLKHLHDVAKIKVKNVDGKLIEYIFL